MTIATTFLKAFEPNVVDNAAPETLYTVPTTPSTTKAMGFVIRYKNTTGGAVTLTSWAVPLSGTAADGNEVYSGSIPADDFVDVEYGTLKAGDFIQAQAGAATSITAHFQAGRLIS